MLSLVASLAACTRPVSVATRPPAEGSCPGATFAIAGACLSLDDAKRYCERAAVPVGGGCAAQACERGVPLDPTTGECATALTVRRLSQGSGAGDASPGCAMPEAGLWVEGDLAACIARRDTCGRGARWDDAGCAPEPVCPQGTVADTTKPARPCVSVVVRERGEEPRLDVGTWVRLVLGPDGSSGTAAVCGPLVQHPWRARVYPRSVGVVEVNVELVFPDNDVSRARATARAVRPFDPHDLANLSLAIDTAYLEPLWTALRAVGGVASAASTSVHLRCVVDGGAPLGGGSAEAPVDAGAAEAGKPGKPHRHKGP